MRRLTGQQVATVVAEHYGITMSALTGPSRSLWCVKPRQMAMRLMRRFCPHLSYRQIGIILGGRDHTTVVHGARAVSDLIEVDTEARHQFNTLSARIADIRWETNADLIADIDVSIDLAVTILTMLYAMRANVRLEMTAAP